MTALIPLFVTMSDGSTREIAGASGDTVLTLSRRFDLGLEGACGGQMACSTCRVEVADTCLGVLDRPTAEEDELLSLVPGRTRRSRLGCQIRLRDTMNRLEFAIPKNAINLWSG